MEAAAAEVPAVSAEPKAASAPLPSPHKQAAPPASQSQASQPSKQTSAAVKGEQPPDWRPLTMRCHLPTTNQLACYISCHSILQPRAFPCVQPSVPAALPAALHR